MIRKAFSLLVVVALAAFFSGCATKIPVQVLKPAEINVGQVKKIAVLDFEFRGSWDFGEKENKDILTRALEKGLGLEEAKTPPPDPLTAYPGKEVSSKFIAKLVDNKHFTVVEREQLSKIFAEQQLSMSGAIDDSQAVKIGRLLGVDALIFGTGAYSVKDSGDWRTRQKKDKNGTTTEKYYQVERKVNAQLTYRITNVSTGLVVASKSNTDSQICNQGGMFSSCGDAYTAEGSNEKNARSNLTDWRTLIDQQVDRLLDKAVKQIAPHYVTEIKELEGGKTKPMDVALDYAKRNFWQEAKETWESVLQDTSPNGMKDHIAAKYNLGIYCEVNGDLAGAEKLFDECYKKSGKTKYLDARARIQARKAELRKLQDQQK